MVYGGYSYLDANYRPGKKKDFVVLFWVEGRKELSVLAEAIAAESSVGTWTKLTTLTEKSEAWKYRARVFRIDAVKRNKGFVWIAYPIEHFDIKNLAQLQASILGNIFGMKELTSLYVLDINYPELFQNMFEGSTYGIDGIRKIIKVKDRPLVGSIIKPKVGLSPKQFAEVAYKTYKGGADFIKDDENLVDQRFCRWKERVNEMLKVIDKIEKEEGKKVLYSPNITDTFDRMVERIEYLKQHGHKMIMLDLYVLGWPLLSMIVEVAKKYKMAIHGHRAGYAALHRSTSFGISYQVFEKFYRIIGIDQLHIGTGVGKMEGCPIWIRRLRDIYQEQKGDEKLYLGSLAFEWKSNIRPNMVVASGGLDPCKVEAVYELLGKDVVINAGGGIHGFPGGSERGARAMLLAVEAAVNDIPLPEFAKKHDELKDALKTFKYVNGNEIRKILREERQHMKRWRKKAFSDGMKFIEKMIA